MSDFASISDSQCELKCVMEAYIDPLLTYADFSWCDIESEGTERKCTCSEGKSVFYAAKDVAWIVE